MGTVIRRGDKWRAVVRKKGHKTLTKTFSKKTLADHWIKKTELQIETRRVLTHGQTLGSILEKYRTEIIEKRPFQTKTHFHLRRLARDTKNTDLADMTVDWWVSFIRGLSGSPTSKKRYAGLVTSALKTAEALRDVTVDWASYRRGRAMATSFGLLANGGQRTRRPLPGELEAIKAAHAREWLPLADLIDFAVATAMRSSEVCALRWTDLDETNRMILVRDRKHPFRKLGNHWRVPLLNGAFEIIQRQPRPQKPTDADRIFPYKADTVQTLFRRAAAAAGVVDLHLHDLRHEGISRLFERGFSIQEVSLVSGHTDWSSLRIYTQLKPESLHGGPIGQAKLPAVNE